MNTKFVFVAKKLFLAAVMIYVASTVAIYALQRQLIFIPSENHVLPEDIGLAEVDEIILFMATNLRLYSWYGHAKDDQPTILFFHGNAGNVSNRADRFRHFMAKGYGVFILGYPGYGGSDGSPSETSFLNASQIAYDYLGKQGIGPNDIVIYGESLGTGVAVQLAATVRSRALILEAPMSSVRDIAQSQFPYLPISILLKDQFLSIDYIDQIRMPLLIIHGDSDKIIPISSGRMLFEKAIEPKEFQSIKGAGHNNLDRYVVTEIVQAFLDDVSHGADD